jgi:hypothetical protein
LYKRGDIDGGGHMRTQGEERLPLSQDIQYQLLSGPEGGDGSQLLRLVVVFAGGALATKTIPGVVVGSAVGVRGVSVAIGDTGVDPNIGALLCCVVEVTCKLVGLLISRSVYPLLEKYNREKHKIVQHNIPCRIQQQVAGWLAGRLTTWKLMLSTVPRAGTIVKSRACSACWSTGDGGGMFRPFCR